MRLNSSRIGKILVESGVISKDELSNALKLQRKQKVHKRVEDILIEQGVIDEKRFFEIISKETGYEFIDLYTYKINQKLLEQFPLNLLQNSHILPLEESDTQLHIATSDPFDYDALETIERLAHGHTLIIHLAPSKAIDYFFQNIQIKQKFFELELSIKKEMSEEGDGEIEYSGESAVLKLIRLIIKDATFRNGSDIHIEPGADKAMVRIRIDGILREIQLLDLEVYQSIASRIKILGNLDISEKRKAQDGRFSLSIDENIYDFRLSTVPTLFGESIVMRILDRQKALLRLQELGFAPEVQKQFEKAVRQPYGIILITGPTGSGKTTTLYAVLNEIKSIENKIMTIEDPIEYHLPLIQQVQVNERVNYGFDEAFRSFLRQDPDIIMVGEIRDLATLDTAAQAALTGHLVLSTIHTNDAPGAINRAIQMGLAPYLVADSIVAIVAQRLVRKICPYCKIETPIPKDISENILELLPSYTTLYRGQGCAHCEMTGYIGQILIAEILLFDERISEAVSNGEKKSQIIQKAMEWGLYTPMIYDGINKVLAGITTIEEITRVTRS